jgi:uncharacterized membrane protein
MAFCEKCGAQVAEGAAFCPSCGAARGAGAAKPAGPGSAPGASGLDEHVAGLLCYVLGWVTGLVFFIIDRRPFVRFHAAQSLVTFGGLHLIYFVLGMFFGMSWFLGAGPGLAGGALAIALFSIIRLAALVAWILCMIKAFQHERFKLPLLGDIAENIAGK